MRRTPHRRRKSRFERTAESNDDSTNVILWTSGQFYKNYFFLNVDEEAMPFPHSLIFARNIENCLCGAPENVRQG
jgi:hypothetical protein